MSEFTDSLQAERAQLVPIAEPAELPAALAKQVEAREAYKAAIESRSSREDQKDELNKAATAANQVVADLVGSRERALARMKQIDRMLTAADDVTRHGNALVEKNASIREIRDRLAQFTSITADLEGEVEELKQKRGDALRDYGAAEIAARMAGKTIALPKAITSLDADLESRDAAIAAALSANEESEALLATLSEEATQIRRQLRDALIRRAELEYYEMLPAVLPRIAMLQVCGSGLGYSQNGAFEIHCDDETVRAARAALNAELAGAADA